MEKELQVVGFRIGDETFGVKIGSVREIVRVPEITSVPNAPDTIEGVINLRGKIIPVMDLRNPFGHFQAAASSRIQETRGGRGNCRLREIAAISGAATRIRMGTLTAQIQLTEAELKLLQTLVYQECGMFFDERRSHFLKDRLQRRLKACQLDSFYAYYRLLTSREGRAELALLLENLTVNETSFFRNRPQLDLLQKSVLEEILRKKQERRDWTLRVWSAGCSSGQEAYTVAILICDALAYYYLRNPLPFDMPSPKPLIPPPWKLEILASDISYASLRAGQAGVYTETQMEPVDYTCRLRYFEKSADKYSIKAQLKDLVQFDFHNLKTEFLPRRNDMILCRNVMIYFDEAEQKRLIDKFYNCLNPGGYLFVGHAESLFGLTQKFRMVHENNGTAYQRLEVNS